MQKTRRPPSAGHKAQTPTCVFTLRCRTKLNYFEKQSVYLPVASFYSTKQAAVDAPESTEIEFLQFLHNERKADMKVTQGDRLAYNEAFKQRPASLVVSVFFKWMQR